MLKKNFGYIGNFLIFVFSFRDDDHKRVSGQDERQNEKIKK